MTTEHSPLLGSDIAPPAQYTGVADERAILDHDAVYRRFTNAQKRVIVALVSWAGLVPLFVSGSFIPAIPQVAREFNSTGSIVNLAISLSIFAVALGTLVWASYSGFYGRRPIYLLSLPILAIGSLGVASARTISTLMACCVSAMLERERDIAGRGLRGMTSVDRGRGRREIGELVVNGLFGLDVGLWGNENPSWASGEGNVCESDERTELMEDVRREESVRQALPRCVMSVLGCRVWWSSGSSGLTFDFHNIRSHLAVNY
ncbi:hypothetical protein EWM64_g1236 [Hericium alpestre]|uniref:Major facilitator superfamily (MFS) profile domain-containing protein n=1 Tax=Hericium alpestre TaxID=135208 RepID=A0A4Z0AA12_9AGAM|nr:hypothetical protein EWM64_g1236 [Hericium alpestre]